MIPLAALAAIAAVVYAVRFGRRRRAAQAAAARAELREHERFTQAIRAVADGDVVILEVRRRARLAVQRATEPESSVGSSDV